MMKVCVCLLQGNKMHFECSYISSYDDATDSEELKMNIDSVSVVPKESVKVESIYSAEASQFGKVSLD